jgi:hypothetical protein
MRWARHTAWGTWSRIRAAPGRAAPIRQFADTVTTGACVRWIIVVSYVAGGMMRGILVGMVVVKLAIAQI